MLLTKLLHTWVILLAGQLALVFAAGPSHVYELLAFYGYYRAGWKAFGKGQTIMLPASVKGNTGSGPNGMLTLSEFADRYNNKNIGTSTVAETPDDIEAMATQLRSQNLGGTARMRILAPGTNFKYNSWVQGLGHSYVQIRQMVDPNNLVDEHKMIVGATQKVPPSRLTDLRQTKYIAGDIATSFLGNDRSKIFFQPDGTIDLQKTVTQNLGDIRIAFSIDPNDPNAEAEAKQSLKNWVAGYGDPTRAPPGGPGYTKAAIGHSAAQQVWEENWRIVKSTC